MIKKYIYPDEMAHYIRNHQISVFFVDVWMDTVELLLCALCDSCWIQKEERKIFVLDNKQNIQLLWQSKFYRDNRFLEIPFSVIVKKSELRKMDKKGPIVLLVNIEVINYLEEIDVKMTDVLVVHNIKYIRNCASKRYKGILELRKKFQRIIVFAPKSELNEIDNLWDEFYLLDHGLRLGLNKSAYMERYFFRSKAKNNGEELLYEKKPKAKENISNKIMDVSAFVYDDRESEECVMKRNVYVFWNAGDYAKYQILSAWMRNKYEIGRGSKEYQIKKVIRKLSQMAAGVVKSRKKIIIFHDYKIRAVRNLIGLYPDKKILIAYWYKHEKDYIQKHFSVTISVENKESAELWRKGTERVGLICPSIEKNYMMMCGGCDILIWFSLTWYFRLYKRLNYYMRRYNEKLLVLHLLSIDTIDENMLNYINNENEKDLCDDIVKWELIDGTDNVRENFLQ